MNCNEEFVTRALGKLTLEMNFDWDKQSIVREILHNSLDKYEVISTETGLVVSDLEEKITLFLQVKRLEKYSDETLKNYFYVLRDLSKFVIKPVSVINKNDIRIYLATISNTVKASTLNSKIHVLKSFFQWLENEDIIFKNPMNHIKTTKTPKRLGKSLSIEELEKIRMNCDTDRTRALVEFLFATGCRVSEVVKLNTRDINYHDGCVKVIGKGDKERLVYFSSITALHLKKYIDSRSDDTPALFVSLKRPYNRMGVRGIEQIISTLGKNSGISKSLFPHRMRHSLATISLASGANITTIQKILGHSSVETTLRYAVVQDDDVRHEYKQRFVH